MIDMLPNKSLEPTERGVLSYDQRIPKSRSVSTLRPKNVYLCINAFATIA
jgi:hypothetical protein